MYIDLITRIKNAQAVKKESLKVPFSNMDLAVAEVLAQHGYIDDVQKKGRMPKRIIEIKLKYENGQGVISGVKLISKPSRRIYAGYQELWPVRQGYGLGVISTSKGVMTYSDAHKAKLGGQRLFEIWWGAHHLSSLPQGEWFAYNGYGWLKC